MQRESITPGEDVDALDLEIIGKLRHDGRLSNRELARELGSSEATVRRRVKALMDAGHIKIVAIANPYQLGYAIDVIMGVQVKPGLVREAADGFAASENVRAVTIMSGAVDLIIAAMFRDNDELLEFLTHVVAKIPGVVRIETSHSLSVVKRAFDLFPEGSIDS
jgi:Lrp/AsnC family transcriptional regulator, regulator for asnA, asnC and gidA